MHRIDEWKKALQIQWQLRSKIIRPVSPGTIILWDTFGELKNAYALATTAFVGGSLKPLGGHNFIEPLISGVPTVTGPFLNDFAWVGDDIFKTGIIKKTEDKEAVLNTMLDYLHHPLNRHSVMEKALVFLRAKQGGSTVACNIINSYLSQN